MFAWSELATDDVEGAKRLFGETLGWTYEPMETPRGDTYWVAKVGDRAVAGLFDKEQFGLHDVPTSWLGYVEVDDVDARVRQAQTLGAALRRPMLDVPGVGRIGILGHKAGGVLAFITSVPRHA
jgi:predicted enzyme related to lactoylglutathione lyase